ncbi:MAG: glycosyltransferase family 2 protein [Candidatus Bathyarchaeia archaeon]
MKVGEQNEWKKQHQTSRRNVRRKSGFTIYEEESVVYFQQIDGDLDVLPQQSDAPDVSVIIPAYNEEETIAEVLRRMIKVSWSLGNVEIIVVDDGSSDRTREEVTAFPLVKCFSHAVNRGKGAAVRTGIENSHGKVVVINDADLEYEPEYLPMLVKPILDGSSDIVYGSRFKGDTDGMSFSHYVGNSVLSLMARFLYSREITDIMTGQKAFRRSILDGAKLREDGFAVEVEMTCAGLNAGRRFKEVPIPYLYRRHGYSKIANMDGVRSFIKLITLFLTTNG